MNGSEASKAVGYALDVGATTTLSQGARTCIINGATCRLGIGGLVPSYCSKSSVDKG